MNPSSHGAASGASSAAASRTNPPSRQSPQPSQTPPMPTSRPTSSHKAQKQTSSSQLNSTVNTRAMNSARSFESTKSRRSNDSLTATRTPKTTATPPPIPNPNEALLKTLQTQFTALRDVISCNICYGLLYEPYTTACGHTYCYICFCKTFLPNQTPTCPECRGKLANPPAPAYAVREMVHTLIAKQELLPAGETLEQHRGWQKEHADFIQKDKENKNPRDGGLWRGFFRPRRPRMFPIHDTEDGVDRCPFCTWELEGGMCNRCGLPIDENGPGEWAFSDVASERASMYSGQDIIIEEGYDFEDEYDLEDDFIDDGEEDEWEQDPYAEEVGFDQPFTIQRMLGGHASRRVASHSASGNRSQYSASVLGSELDTLGEEDEDGDQDSSTTSGFIARNDDPVAHTGYHRDSTPTSASRSSAFPESIAEDDEEEEDEVSIVLGRRRLQSTMSSTPTITNSGQHSSQAQLQQPASQVHRRRRVISESPSTESASSSAPAEEDDDEAPIAPASRRRRRPLSQEEPMRRVRPRPRGSSDASQDGPNAYDGYRPLGTPQIGEEEEEDDMSDGARTAVGWEPITSTNTLARDTGSLTPTADRPPTPPRPVSRSSFTLGSRGLRRRSSVLNTTQHYEDNDADGESDTQLADAMPVLQSRVSQARLRTVPPHQPVSVVVAASDTVQNDDTDSGETETSLQARRRGTLARVRRDLDPHLRLLLAEHQTEVQVSEPEGPVYPELEHLRGINRTPVTRPRTSNRNRNNATAQVAPPIVTRATVGTPVRSMQQVYSPSRVRAAPELVQVINPVTGSSRTAYIQSSPRNSFSGPSGAAARFRSLADANAARNNMQQQSAPGPGSELRLQAANAALMRSLQCSTPLANASPQSRQNGAASGSQSPRMVQTNDFIERPVSRVSYRNGYIIQHAPAPASRPPSNPNRPPSGTGSRRASLTRPGFAPPPAAGTSGVGLNTARVWQFHPSNPFSGGLRRPPSQQRLQNQASTQTLRQQRSIRVMRGPPPQIVEQETDQTSPQMRPSASRMHLRPQPSYRRMHAQREPSVLQYQQPAQYQTPPLHQSPVQYEASVQYQPPVQYQPSVQYQQPVRDQETQRTTHATQAPPAEPQNTTRYSPASSTLSGDERSRRATELVRRRLQELTQQTRTSPAAVARANTAPVHSLVEQRLAAITRGAQQTNRAAPVTTTTSTANAVGTTNAVSGQAPMGISPAGGARSLPSVQLSDSPAPGPVASAPTRSQGTLASGQGTMSTSSAQRGHGLEQAQARGVSNSESISRVTNVQAAPGRSQVPGMTAGTTALTAGGDNRRN